MDGDIELQEGKRNHPRKQDSLQEEEVSNGKAKTTNTGSKKDS